MIVTCVVWQDRLSGWNSVHRSRVGSKHASCGRPTSLLVTPTFPVTSFDEVPEDLRCKLCFSWAMAEKRSRTNGPLLPPVSLIMTEAWDRLAFGCGSPRP